MRRAERAPAGWGRGSGLRGGARPAVSGVPGRWQHWAKERSRGPGASPAGTLSREPDPVPSFNPLARVYRQGSRTKMQVTCPRSRSRRVAELGFKSRQLGGLSPRTPKSPKMIVKTTIPSRQLLSSSCVPYMMYTFISILPMRKTEAQRSDSGNQGGSNV